MEERAEKKVQEAFASLRRPDGLDEKTLAYIEAANPNNSNASEFVVMRSAKKRPSVRRGAYIGIAACLAFALVCFGGWNLYSIPVAYADVESTGVIQLAVNRFDRVVKVDTYSAEGEAMLGSLAEANISLVGMSYEDALSAIAGSSLCADPAAGVSVTVACDSKEMSKRMMRQSANSMKETSGSCYEADMSDCAQAREAGMGMHRYQQACELVKDGQVSSVDECKNLTAEDMEGLCKGQGQGRHKNQESACAEAGDSHE